MITNKDTLYFIGTALLVVAILTAMMMIFVSMIFYSEGYTIDTKTITKTITIDKYVEGHEWRNRGFIDTEGDGYVVLSLVMFTMGGTQQYNITYFCDSNNLRKVVRMEYIPKAPPEPTPIPSPTPDVFLCKTINGVCQ